MMVQSSSVSFHSSLHVDVRTSVCSKSQKQEFYFWRSPNQYDLQKRPPPNQSPSRHRVEKIPSGSSGWQLGLPFTPFMQIPAAPLTSRAGWGVAGKGWAPPLFPGRRVGWKIESGAKTFARQSTFFPPPSFLMNHCYAGAVVSPRNEPVRYFHSVSPRAIDSCLFVQIECRCWCNESVAACKGGVAEAEVVQSGASAAADMMCAAPDEGGRKKKKAFTSCAENIMEVNAKSPRRSHYPLLIPLIECVPVIAEQR